MSILFVSDHHLGSLFGWNCFCRGFSGSPCRLKRCWHVPRSYVWAKLHWLTLAKNGKWIVRLMLWTWKSGLLLPDVWQEEMGFVPGRVPQAMFLQWNRLCQQNGHQKIHLKSTLLKNLRSSWAMTWVYDFLIFEDRSSQTMRWRSLEC